MPELGTLPEPANEPAESSCEAAPVACGMLQPMLPAGAGLRTRAWQCVHVPGLLSGLAWLRQLIVLARNEVLLWIENL